MYRLQRSSRPISVGVALVSILAVGCGGGGGGGTVAPPPPPPPVAAVASVKVSPTTATLQIGGTSTLSATTLDASSNVLTGRSVTWSTSSAQVATVTQGGVVTAVAAGTATVTATSEGKAGSAQITVAPPAPVASISLAVSPAANTTLLTAVVDSVNLGRATVVATLRDAAGNVLTGRTVAWSSDANTVATVNSTGLVAAVAPGSATITATSEGKTATVAFTVVRPAVAQVSVSPTTVSLKPGQTQALTINLLDAQGHQLTNRFITEPSSNTAVVTAQGGVLTAGTTAGTATVTVTSEGVKTVVTVTVAP